MNKLFAFLPCYNEEKNIGPLIDEWMEQAERLEQAGFDLQVRAIDDDSKDETRSVIQKRAEQYPAHVSLIAHDVNKNLCGGLNTSISYFFGSRECLRFDGAHGW